MQNLIIDEITKAVWNEFTAKTHNENRDYQYSVTDLRNVITEAYKNAEALQLQQTGVNKCIIMTHREKAIELFRKFWTLENSFGQQSIYKGEAINCALACCDEILSISKLQDIESQNYWQKIKEEIHKL